MKTTQIDKKTVLKENLETFLYKLETSKQVPNKDPFLKILITQLNYTIEFYDNFTNDELLIINNILVKYLK